jgi:hypothetical protein
MVKRVHDAGDGAGVRAAWALFAAEAEAFGGGGGLWGRRGLDDHALVHWPLSFGADRMAPVLQSGWARSTLGASAVSQGLNEKALLDAASPR